MTIQKVCDLDPIFETAGLLYLSQHRDNHREEFIRVLTEMGIDGALFYKKHMSVHEKYIKAFMTKCRLTKKESSFFLEDEEGDFHLLFTYLFSAHPQWLENLSEVSDEELRETLLLFLTDGLAEETIPKDLSLSDLIKRIDESSYSLAGRWKILTVYEDPRKWFSLFRELLNENLPAFVHARTAVQKPLDKLLERFSAHEDQQFQNLVKEFAESLTLYPTLIFPVSQLIISKNGYYGLLLDVFLQKSKSQRSSNDFLLLRIKALSDHSKLAILGLLKQRPFYNQELAEKLNLTTATVSYHMNTLLAADFVKIEKRDSRIYYSLEKGHLKEFLQELEEILL